MRVFGEVGGAGAKGFWRRGVADVDVDGEGGGAVGGGGEEAGGGGEWGEGGRHDCGGGGWRLEM